MFNLRRYFLLDPSVTYLNHGSFGATPRPVLRAYQDWQRQLERQPVEFLGRRFRDLMSAARAALGDYLGTAADNLVYTTNVTESLNIVARSLDLGPGDEVLSTDHEYGALDRTWRFLSKERRFKYINQPISFTTETTENAEKNKKQRTKISVDSANSVVNSFSIQHFVDELWKGVTPRTRVIFLSHITSPTALLFPVEAVIRRARRAGIITVIDGAHAPGQIPLRLDDLDADFYGGNLHKWLCAPKGAGFLYARPEAQHLLKPLVVSWGYEAEIPGPSQFVDHHEWTGTRDIAAFLSVPAAIEFQQEHDWENVRRACRALAHEAQEQICALTQRPPISGFENGGTTGGSGLQMVAAPLPDSVDLAALKARLYDEYRIEVPLIAWNGRKLIRVSVQGYNTRQDVGKLVQALEELQSAA
ncbi:MAG: aminotransferase class V-fold PLP-dependent enzyme [Chloroflexi bacterium]|nr:aminotransferase class V-fold PLP-dependent enzyme [Chloroflexota bacterium]